MSKLIISLVGNNQQDTPFFLLPHTSEMTSSIWTGIGAVGAFLVGIIVLSEPVSSERIVAAALILTGLILMKLSSV